MRLPDFAASDAARRFSADLYLEHLEEASFLYEQRLGLYDDPEITWLDIAKFEERLAAHLAALLGGGTVALETCQGKTTEGEPGELYSAVCVFCRAGRRDLVADVLKRLDADNALRSRAVSDAMADEMPAEWGPALAKSLSQGYDKLIPIVARYVGYRRIASAGALDALIAGPAPAKGLAELLWAWGRVGEPGVAPQVAGFLEHDDPAVRTNAAIALLRQGDDGVLAMCRAGAARGDAAMFLPLAIAGGRSEAALLRNVALTQPGDAAALIALGVLGDLGAVRLLVDRLSDQEVAAAAAAALHLMTGAILRESAFILEPVQEDELFEDERQIYQETGEAPRRSDGRPFGVSVERTSQNPDDWQNWLDDQMGRLDATQRYRLGKPFSVGTLVDTMVTPACSRQIRALAAEELVIRYGIDHPFETEMRVNEQKRQINEIARIGRAKEASFQAGDWFFAGKLT